MIDYFNEILEIEKELKAVYAFGNMKVPKLDDYTEALKALTPEPFTWEALMAQTGPPTYEQALAQQQAAQHNALYRQMLNAYNFMQEPRSLHGR